MLDSVFHALADPARRTMLERLTRGPASVSELAEPFSMSLPGVMQHLKVLDDAGLTISEKRGRVRWRRLNLERMAAAEAWIGERRRIWTVRLNALERHLASAKDN
ncbi:MAG TPA: metalloregulator ArsR/SmtB family transcription factor [Caulobacteraceae bacterium]|nr:metalloregulator ArsR/SmtB family transcription factor [Caulobacteraceae bacterium]